MISITPLKVCAKNSYKNLKNVPKYAPILNINCNTKVIKYKLNSVRFVKTYTWDYKNKNGEKRKDFIQAGQGKVLMVIDDTIEYDETTPYYINTQHDFYTDFATLNYTYNNLEGPKEYTNTLKNVTPSSQKEVKIYEVSSLALNSTNKRLIINIRNKTITILLD